MAKHDDYKLREIFWLQNTIIGAPLIIEISFVMYRYQLDFLVNIVDDDELSALMTLP